MNFLGHAYLSFGNAETLCGNLFGDFVKGSHSLTNYPVGIKKGILLHRKIDEFTDTHFAMVDAKNIFRPIYGLYAGAMLDTVMDYFLANDENIFANETTLQLFVQKVYAQLGENSQFFPINFVPYYESMIQHNWLFHYRNEEGIRRSLNGLKKRAKHIDEVDTAFRLFNENKNTLEKAYSQFITDIISFVKIEME